MRPQLQKRYAFETETDDGSLVGVFVTLVPNASLCGQHLGMLVRKTIKTRTAQTIFTLDEEAQCHRQFSECLLIRLDCRQTCNQITLAVRRTACVKLAVCNRGGEWS